jgi:hypothetical protein
MNKRIILIEDRPERLSQFLGDNKINELKILNGLTILSGQHCQEVIEKINSTADILSLNEYKLIIIHRSALKDLGISNLINYCKKNKKDLIFFSGGISQSVFSSNDFNYLLVNSKELYQPHLKNFLSKYILGNIKHLSELIYGDKWKICIMLSLRQLLLKGELDRMSSELKEQYQNLIGINSLEDLNKEIDKEILII